MLPPLLLRPLRNQNCGVNVVRKHYNAFGLQQRITQGDSDRSGVAAAWERQQSADLVPERDTTGHVISYISAKFIGKVWRFSF